MKEGRRAIASPSSFPCATLIGSKSADLIDHAFARRRSTTFPIFKTVATK
jgi:hypothetical protein